MTILQTFMDTYTPIIERELARVFPEGWVIPDKLSESMRYSLLSGGKRLRPLMVIAAAQAVGGKAESVLPVACAVELVHTYSLIHDDLPAMDDDDYRRGRLTNHKVFGEAMAILAGDGLLTHAFYMLSREARKQGIDADVILDIIADLSVYAGASGMVGGQAADMIGEQGITDIGQLEYIHLHKTSDLLVFALLAGGKCAGAGGRQLDALAQYGRSIGLAFQIQDDILDVIGDEEKMGKRTNSDRKKNKATYPHFIGLEASKAKVRNLTETGKQALMNGELSDPSILIALADYLLDRDR
jgi:geranylgeranyl diphosphate synthase type II